MYPRGFWKWMGALSLMNLTGIARLAWFGKLWSGGSLFELVFFVFFASMARYAYRNRPPLEGVYPKADLPRKVQELVAEAEAAGHRVVYADTDSIFVDSRKK